MPSAGGVGRGGARRVIRLVREFRNFNRISRRRAVSIYQSGGGRLHGARRRFDRYIVARGRGFYARRRSNIPHRRRRKRR
ncbi:MAG TPA: hypothetical protein VNI84_17320 [Pyrinomonadaceae bacterium]|nr:hypothetical protein [Pyrinomonadaceae bacterium]